MGTQSTCCFDSMKCDDAKFSFYYYLSLWSFRSEFYVFSLVWPTNLILTNMPQLLFIPSLFGFWISRHIHLSWGTEKISLSLSLVFMRVHVYSGLFWIFFFLSIKNPEVLMLVSAPLMPPTHRKYTRGTLWCYLWNISGYFFYLV